MVYNRKMHSNTTSILIHSYQNQQKDKDTRNDMQNNKPKNISNTSMYIHSSIKSNNCLGKRKLIL